MAIKNNFRRNLQIGFGLSLLLLLLSSVASYYSIISLIRNADMVNHTHLVLQEAENIISNMKDAETAQRGYALTGDYEFLEPYNGAYERTKTAFDNIKKLTTDNITQQSNCDTLSKIIDKRFIILQEGIDQVKQHKAIDIFLLRNGKVHMEQARNMIIKMENIEQKLLVERTDTLNKNIAYTKPLIIVVALLALSTTIFFFKRVNDEYREKELLNDSLCKKDEEIANRITVIQKIAGSISAGNYKIRLDAAENDGLGSLSGSLNKMAESLDTSFKLLSKNEWLQKGAAQLSETMTGDKTTSTLSDDIIDFIANYTNSQVGTLYLCSNPSELQLQSVYGLIQGNSPKLLTGEGLAGQAFAEAKTIILNDIDDTLYINAVLGSIKPRTIIATPVFFEGVVTGVIELGSIQTYSPEITEYLSAVSGLIGVALNTAYNRTKLQELLEETQSQAEELQTQHSELENVNTELEAQSEKLQISEEELKVQQEELMETNQELEERSRLLEEKNHLIVIRNLDIQKKAEELALSTKYKSEFLANMSHELRTPLNSILLLSRLLTENNNNTLNNDEVEYASVIRSSGQGLLQLIDEILDLSKIESGKMQLEYAPVFIEEMIKDLRHMFEPLANEKNVALNIFIEAGIPDRIETDRLRVEQVLRNLMSNALKFTSRGTIDLKVSCDPQQKDIVSFSVKDTGIGIPEEKQQLVFEAFQQADGSTKRKYGGTGLGLSISRQLARLLAGDIILKSEAGAGSEFIFTIPVNKETAMLTKPQEVKEPVAEPVERSVEKTAANNFVATKIPADIPDDRNIIVPADKIILIVEDDTTFAKALLDFSRQKGYKGIVAVRGDQGIELARTYKPSGILLDIQLPVKDGLQVIDELKNNPETRHIPVHMMSSHEAKKESLSKGAIDFISKPFAYEQMSDVFRKIEHVIKNDLKKVIIVEDNSKHAKALEYFLSTFDINATISADIHETMLSLKKEEINCVILDMGVPDVKAYDTLEIVRSNEGLENIPIIIFTGKNLSRAEEQHIKQYADSIVLKTAHSYQRILDEITLFLHLVETKNTSKRAGFLAKKLGSLDQVLQNKTVLVADDDVRNIFSLTKALEKHKMNIISATDGKEALNALKENTKIDIVLMDMMMPEMDGYDTIKNIRSNPAYRQLPVIAVTAKAMTGDREKCIQAGASDYISKPIDTDQLISLMRIWLYESV